MKMFRYFCGAIVLLAGQAANAAITYNETTDFPNGSGFGVGSVSIGTLTQGFNIVNGGISGNCINYGGSNRFDCNSQSGVDTQDSFLFTIANGFILKDVVVKTTTSVGTAENVKFSFNLRNQTNYDLNVSGLQTSRSFYQRYDAGPGVYSFSFYGADATKAGTYGIDYNLDFSVAAVPEPATWTMMLGGFALVGGAMRVRRRRVAMAV